jgi:hypothetical protein
MKQDFSAHLIEYRAHYIVIAHTHAPYRDNHLARSGLPLDLIAQGRALVSNNGSQVSFPSDSLDKRCQRSTVALRESAGGQ